MPQRLQRPPRPDPPRARRWPRPSGDWAARTIPGDVARELTPQGEPTLLGFPAEFPDADDMAEREIEPDDVPFSDGELVVLRRADRLGAVALILAGVAANVSLSLSWSSGGGPSGLFQVERGIEVFVSGAIGSVPLSTWQPPVVVLGGGLLVLLGCLLLVPARSHRFVGVLALLVSLAAAVSVVVLLAGTGWRVARLGPGMWCAVAVPLLGLLGSLKAMLTLPLVTLGQR